MCMQVYCIYIIRNTMNKDKVIGTYLDKEWVYMI